MEQPASYWMIEPLRKYATFGGRARRAEFWWFALFYGLILIAASIADIVFFGLDNGFGGSGLGLFGGLTGLAFILPNLAVSMRRLHDLDRSGWWLLIGIIPLIGGIILFIWFCSRGTQGPNTYGEDPLNTPQFFT
jgi:uncharacterized membrane protein YhaH (DUF805 family)